ncbi:hypothetical protein [Myxococcus llanfairpwllgwyngyllgogerychwyrndrobwllllantysiliogogogochensis]|nr:hypothetical protein [Myxococcus llanfairpwllgwyngyllgogerychwyrndrobwllllantysiliogogogochensis]
MPKAGTLKHEDILRLKERLSNEAAVPTRVDLTKIEAVSQLLPQIKALQSKGYRVADIAKVLTDEGLPINEATLNTTLTTIKARAKEAEKATKKHQVKERTATGRSEAKANDTTRGGAPRVAAPKGQPKLSLSEGLAGPATVRDSPQKPMPSEESEPRQAGPVTNKGVFEPVPDSEVI